MSIGYRVIEACYGDTISKENKTAIRGKMEGREWRRENGGQEVLESERERCDGQFNANKIYGV